MSKFQICEAFDLLAQLAIKKKLTPIKDKLVDMVINKKWKVKMNGFMEEKENIPFCSAAIEYNGWPAGIINPKGGIIAAGSEANEGTFCKAIKKALEAKP